MASRYRFGLAPLFLLMLPACTMAAAGYYLVSSGWLTEANAGSENPLALLPFLAFTLASPCVLIVILGLIYRISQWSWFQSRDENPS